MKTCPKCNTEISVKKQFSMNYGLGTHCDKCKYIITFKKDITYFVPNIIMIMVILYFVVYVANGNMILVVLFLLSGLLIQNIAAIQIPFNIKAEKNINTSKKNDTK